MATSEASVCNLALARCGHRQLLNSLDEATAEAQLCKAVFADVRDAVLARLQWPFATRRASLASPAGVTRSGWAHVYVLPEDCIAPSYLYAGTRAPTAKQRIPFAEEVNDGATGRLLLTDLADAELVYIARVTKPVLWHPLFVQALAWALACELALSLAVKPQVAMAMKQQYEAALLTAQAAALNQAQEDGEPDSEIITERG